MTKKSWIEKALNRTDAGNWDYSKTSKAISEIGGTKEFISKIFDDGFREGRIAGAVTMLAVTTVIGGCSWGAYKYKEYKKKKFEERYYEKIQDEQGVEE